MLCDMACTWLIPSPEEAMLPRRRVGFEEPCPSAGGIAASHTRTPLKTSSYFSFRCALVGMVVLPAKTVMLVDSAKGSQSLPCRLSDGDCPETLTRPLPRSGRLASRHRGSLTDLQPLIWPGVELTCGCRKKAMAHALWHQNQELTRREPRHRSTCVMFISASTLFRIQFVIQENQYSGKESNERASQSSNPSALGWVSFSHSCRPSLPGVPSILSARRQGPGIPATGDAAMLPKPVCPRTS